MLMLTLLIWQVSGGRVLVTEVRPVPRNLSCNGATVRTDKWMELCHWQVRQYYCIT